MEDYYEHDLHDQSIRAEIAAYKISEPNDVVNEMHSVFGTEIIKLPAPLEQYYRQYFKDRSNIGRYAASYRSAFTSRETKVNQYDRQLSSLKSSITSDENALSNKLKIINSEKSQLDGLRSTGNNAAYNIEVPIYNSTVENYNTLIDQLRGMIASYNATVNKRNELALEENHLAQELNSNSTLINQ